MGVAYDSTTGCIEAVNKYRSMAGTPPTVECPKANVDFAGQMADYDNDWLDVPNFNYHSWLNDGKSTDGICPTGTKLLSLPQNLSDLKDKPTSWGGQCEVAFPDGYIPGKAGHQDEAIHCYYQEGPDGSRPGSGPCSIPSGMHGHYDLIIKPENIACVACGHSPGNNFYVHNICVPAGDDKTAHVVV